MQFENRRKHRRGRNRDIWRLLYEELDRKAVIGVLTVTTVEPHIKGGQAHHRETHLLAQARGLGLRSVDGSGMLLFQGVVAFEIWTGQPAPVEVMRQALL